MEIASYVQGISARRFAMDEVLPIGGVAYNNFTNTVRARYNFQSVGISAEAQQKGSAAPAFELGEFSWNGAQHTVFGLEFTTEGLRATSYTTEAADAFISDLFEFAHDVYGYRINNITKPAVYGSAILVRLNERDLSFFSFLKDSSRLLQDELEAIGKPFKTKPFGVRLIASEGDPKSGALYIFEKRAGAEASEDVYFSQAPLPTVSHERFLSRLFPES